jgi:hypothetical protein
MFRSMAAIFRESLVTIEYVSINTLSKMSINKLLTVPSNKTIAKMYKYRITVKFQISIYIYVGTANGHLAMC